MSVAPDHGAREHAALHPGSVLVQAPAGSGKTTLLAQRYLRLLALVDSPERILALTFTRRAAQEMRERVLQALAAAGSPICPPHLNAVTWTLGQAARMRLREKGIDVERHPSRLRIETIDSFNAWLAGQVPVTAQAGSRLHLSERADPMYEEAARRALSHEDPDAFGAAVDTVLAEGDQRWASLVKLIAGMLKSRDRWLPLLAGHLGASRALPEAQLRRVRRHLDEDLHLLVTRRVAVAHGAIGALRLAALSRLLNNAAQRLAPQADTLAAWREEATPLRADADDTRRWREAADLLLIKGGAFRTRLTKSEGFPSKCADKEMMADLIRELERLPGVLPALLEIRTLPAPRYDDAQWARVREVAEVLVLAAAELSQVFRERGTVDFPAVSMAAVRALGSAAAPTDLNLRLDYQLEHILVDEFQDTSSAQLELVKLLTAGWQRDDGRSVFCVGDPMQSIYGFRQAEVRAFLELAEEGIGEVQFDVLRLQSNFRSAAPVIEWINACFSRILPRVDDRNRGAIAFRPSVAARAGESDDAGVVLRGFASRAAEAQGIAALIAQHASRHPDWRIVVLVRAKSHARELAAALRAADIAFRAVDIEPLRDRPVVRDLLALIRALLHAGDRIAWLALLRGPWVGLTLADLLRVARAAPIIWDGLRDAGALADLSADGRARCARLVHVLNAAFRSGAAEGVARWVECTWLALGGAACATGPSDLEHVDSVLNRLRELEQSGLPDAADLEGEFDDLFAASGADAALEIMTIHKSKGLEFDMVVVPALERHISPHGDPLLLSHQFARGGRDGLIMAARPGIGAARDDLFEFLRHQARDAAALEAQRLLYVACTRAKHRLLLTATIAARDAGEGDEDATGATFTPRAGSLLGVLWPVSGAEFSDPGVAVPAPPSPPRGAALRRVPSGWSPALDTILAGTDAPQAVVVREASPVFDWAGETARRVGILVHAELQTLDVERSDAATIRARESHFRRWLGVHGVPPDRLEEAAGRVVSALVQVHSDARAGWMLKRWKRDDFREHALSGRWRGEVVRVVFDRSFVDDAGVRWVIDYKTSQHSGGDLEEFLDREVERYKPQLQRYAEFAARLGPEPVRVGLYFPLMRAWRDWTPSNGPAGGITDARGPRR